MCVIIEKNDSYTIDLRIVFISLIYGFQCHKNAIKFFNMRQMTIILKFSINIGLIDNTSQTPVLSGSSATKPPGMKNSDYVHSMHPFTLFKITILHLFKPSF